MATKINDGRGRVGMKSLRDGVGFTGVGVVVSRLAENAGLDAVTASALGLAAATLCASGYRWLRGRWPWLSTLDPAGGGNA